MDFDFGVIPQYWPLFINGLLVTIQVSALGVLLGTGLGIVILLIRQCSVWPARWLANIYLSFFRGTPVIVLALCHFAASVQNDLTAFNQ
ncbi:ABC transporter permease subunit [Alcaligenes endophyticus]|uniref:ABC transporter permease subunit n=1 Tax=Alcaligenes endophyticus TaxID=1929088 RepID=A0ABT8EMR1_9BURK|nr:ABC transporter permease subunit [Alcaligenes endophyticus]MCX5591033.1 ABC transporter permease subunit [Alcaligenes endophyticus]MDN4122390.1 ABC transporter permease subunit [Alcaligenes endophyticus]